MHDMNQLPNGEQDHEGAMAKADLYKLANYSLKLFKKMDDSAQLESWVQAKITKAADYIASVYHYMEYEMKFSEFGAKLENSEMYSESEKIELKNKLMEAKSAIKELKKQQAEKIAANEKPKKEKADLEEGVLSGGEKTCEACGGTGTIHEEPKQIPGHVKAKVAAYNKKAKAMSAAVKRVDKNKNGIPDALEKDSEEITDEDTTVTSKTQHGSQTATFGDDGKRKGVVHKDERTYSDEPHGEAPSIAKSKSAAEKKADKEKEIKLPKHKGNTWGMKSGEKFGNGTPKAKKEKEVEEGQGGIYGQGIYEGTNKKKSIEETITSLDSSKQAGLDRAVSILQKSGFSEEEIRGMMRFVTSSGIPSDAGPKRRQMTKALGKHGVDAFDLGESKKSKPDFLDMDKDGNKKEPMKKAVADKKKNPFAKKDEKVKEALKGGQKKLDVDQDGDIEADDLADLRAKKKSKDVVKEAIARAQLGTSESFLPEATTVVETPVVEAEVINESSDLDRVKQFLTRLNG